MKDESDAPPQQQQESGGRRNHLIDVFSRVALSQPLSRAIDEGGSVSLRQGLKAPVREAWEPSSHQTPLHIKQPGRDAPCSPTVREVEGSTDKRYYT